MDFITAAQLLGQGFTKHEIRTMAAAGRLVRVARGHYRWGLDPKSPGTQANAASADERPEAKQRLAEQQHLALARHFDQHVLAAESAALLHGLPVHVLPPQVQILCPGDGSSWKRSGYDLLSAPLPDHHVTTRDDRLATTIARTVVDVARLRGLVPGLVAWEAARWNARRAEHLEAFDHDVDACLALLRGRAGIETARRVRANASAWSQSPMETRSRWQLIQLGVPDFVQQFEVFNKQGRLLGVTDFAWPELGVLGEYDGLDKYDRLARPGESPFDVMQREKQRQEEIEAEGWVFARWGRKQVARPALLKQRLDQAMAIARGRPGFLFMPAARLG